MEDLKKLKDKNKRLLVESSKRLRTSRMRLSEKEEELEKCKEENKKLIRNLHGLGYFLKGSKLRTVSAASQMHLPPDLEEEIMKAGKKRKSRRRRRSSSCT